MNNHESTCGGCSRSSPIMLIPLSLPFLSLNWNSSLHYFLSKLLNLHCVSRNVCCSVELSGCSVTFSPSLTLEFDRNWGTDLKLAGQTQTHHISLLFVLNTLLAAPSISVLGSIWALAPWHYSLLLEHSGNLFREFLKSPFLDQQRQYSPANSVPSRSQQMHLYCH